LGRRLSRRRRVMPARPPDAASGDCFDRERAYVPGFRSVVLVGHCAMDAQLGLPMATKSFVLIGLALSLGAVAQAQDAVVTRGNEVFQNWCAPCHAPGPRHPGTQALESLYKGAKPAALEQRTDLVPELTRTFVRTGVSVMPPFRKTEISDADLAALAAYLAPKPR
jgi:(+)-pinoresinol hydroxylase